MILRCSYDGDDGRERSRPYRRLCARLSSRGLSLCSPVEGYDLAACLCVGCETKNVRFCRVADWTGGWAGSTPGLLEPSRDNGT
jgi:hypothetical protein